MLGYGWSKDGKEGAVWRGSFGWHQVVVWHPASPSADGWRADVFCGRTSAINIIAKEKEAAELKKKYFGPEGELYKKRESLMAPIQDEIYNAVKEISDQKGYSMVLDRASDAGIIFASPKIDISNEVLAKLGYANN